MNSNSRKKTKPTTNLTSGLTSEADYSVQSTLLQGRIRTQKLHQQTHQLRGETAKAESKRYWADTQEVLRDTQQVRLGIATDNHQGKVKERQINQQEIVQKLAAKSYQVDLKRHKNSGLRQSLLNSEVDLSFDHTEDFNQALK